MILLCASALADLPPPPGTRDVPFEIVVNDLPADLDPALIAYPWSMSNGRPMAEVAEVKPEGLAFGRRVSGTPRFWRVPRSKLAELPQTDDEAELEKWVEANATACEGQVWPRHNVAVLGPSKVIDQYAFQDEPCVLTRVVEGGTGMGDKAGGGTKLDPDAPGGGAPTEGGMCGCASATAPAWAFLLGLLPLARRRA
ncbi:MAG: hypothetical protein H6737_05990 [Alphaproteobacteria bacterium]|nr:hypothetical protein [Alphaproteobacteria bacterium]